MKLISASQCKSSISSQKRSSNHQTDISEKQLCAFNPTTRAAFSEEIGNGPLQFFPHNSVTAKIVSIGSYGGASLPNVYTRVSPYLDWIESEVWPKID